MAEVYFNMNSDHALRQSVFVLVKNSAHQDKYLNLRADLV